MHHYQGPSKWDDPEVARDEVRKRGESVRRGIHGEGFIADPVTVTAFVTRVLSAIA